MKIIAILCAIQEELDAILTLYPNCHTETIANITFYTTSQDNKKIIICRSGVGKISATLCTSILIYHYNTQSVIFSGVAGSLNGQEIPIGSLCIAQNICQGDFDISVFGYPKGVNQPNESQYIQMNQQLIDISHKVAQQLNFTLKTATICTVDHFVSSEQQRKNILQNFPKSQLVEMESYAIAKVCQLTNTNCIIIRSVSDDDRGEAVELFETFAQKVSEKHAQFIKQLALEL